MPNLLLVLCLPFAVPTVLGQDWPDLAVDYRDVEPRTEWRYSASRIGATDKGWGYTYDSLLFDLSKWRSSPFVSVEKAGESVQGRPLWLLTVTDTSLSLHPRSRITIHARTHPGEVQSLYTTREVIRILIGSSPLAAQLRTQCLFSIMPMYNPDGVELGFPRENANGVDLERGWETPYPEPEVATLKRLFETYMESESPIRVALNMHADHRTSKRYFVYHHENGTSASYSDLERVFIGYVHAYWPDGIGDWDWFISWTSGTPPYYPESWFWFNYREAVMALTYEEIPTSDPADYVASAAALLNGVIDYLDNVSTGLIHESDFAGSLIQLFQNYPNPVSTMTTLSYRLQRPAAVSLDLYDGLGRHVSVLASGFRLEGTHSVRWSALDLTSGVYYYRLRSEGLVETKRMVVLR